MGCEGRPRGAALPVTAAAQIDFFACGEPSGPSDLLQQYEVPSTDDGLLEVVGTAGVPHLVAVRFGLQHSVRLAQGSEVHLRVLAPALVAQVDGESWTPAAGDSLTIVREGSVPVVGPLSQN